MKRMRFLLVMAAAGALALAGCDAPGPSRDFDELVPRLLGAIQGKSPEEAAANLFNVTSPDERRDAIAYLEVRSYGHEPAYMRAYELLATDKYPMVRAQAMRALGSSGLPQADYEWDGRKGGKVVDFLVTGLKDADVQVRRDAAYGLMTTWSESATTAAAEKVTRADEDDHVRIFCARALARAREPEAFRALIDALSDKDAAVVKYAHDSLVAATKMDFSYDRKGWLTWYLKAYVSTGAGGAGAAGTPGVAAPTGTMPAGAATRP
jgi:HEAT repeat protein